MLPHHTIPVRTGGMSGARPYLATMESLLDKHWAKRLKPAPLLHFKAIELSTLKLLQSAYAASEISGVVAICNREFHCGHVDRPRKESSIAFGKFPNIFRTDVYLTRPYQRPVPDRHLIEKALVP